MTECGERNIARKIVVVANLDIAPSVSSCAYFFASFLALSAAISSATPGGSLTPDAS